MIEELIKLNFNKEKYIALWKITDNTSSKKKNILLTHGTFSNKKVLSGITEFLVAKGFTCWVFEWRNHGGSSKTHKKFNFETIAKEDFCIVFDYLFLSQNIKKIDCITHSGGGICLTIALIDKPVYKTKISSITLFACQAFGAADTSKKYFKIFIAKYISKLLGYIPANKVGSEEDEDYYLMKQWFNWNLKKKFFGENGIDYSNEMKEIRIPILSISGKGDAFIAPTKGCKQFLEAYNNLDNKYLLCSKEKGFLEDYNHSRILHSKNASKEIYPLVLSWITRQKI